MGEGDVRDEARRAGRQAARGELAVDRAKFHRIVVAVPAGGMHARGIAERVDLESGVVGDGRQASGAGIVDRLEPRVLGERRGGFLRLGDRVAVGERDQRHGHAVQDADDLADLSRIGRGDEQVGHAYFFTISPTMLFWMSMRSLMPLSASDISASSARLSKGLPSAVPCSSMNRPSPVFTKFMSTSARESSSYARSSSAQPSTMPTL